MTDENLARELAMDILDHIHEDYPNLIEEWADDRDDVEVILL